MKELLEKIAVFLEKKEKTADTRMFKEIQPQKEKVCFIDGGHADLLHSADFLFSFLRIIAITYENNKKQSIEKKECYLLVIRENEQYETWCAPSLLASETFSLYDDELAGKNQKVPIRTISGIMRRMLELQTAKENSSCVVLDGSLEGKNTREEKMLKSLGKNVFGLSKTSDEIAFHHSEKKAGYYLYKKNAFITYFVKLHKDAKKTFRFDSFTENVDAVLGSLKENSTDPTLLGYPFGLILADKFARITNKEKDMLLTKAKMQLGKKWKDLVLEDTHDILDKLSY
ncbi:hypothetical protein C4573_00445 [Candidatus Woesearchaeota archaeon]|nr:MAG: hypothetical protein C4573_00445 [Candidatus Woesearchaeota archaeon]